MSAMIPMRWHLNLIRTCPRSGWSFGPLRRQELRDCPSCVLALLSNTTVHFVVAVSSRNTPWRGRYLILSALWSPSSIARAWPSFNVLAHCFTMHSRLLYNICQSSFSRNKSLISLPIVVYKWWMIFLPRKTNFILFTIKTTGTVKLITASSSSTVLWCSWWFTIPIASSSQKRFNWLSELAIFVTVSMALTSSLSLDPETGQLKSQPSLDLVAICVPGRPFSTSPLK